MTAEKMGFLEELVKRNCRVSDSSSELEQGDVDKFNALMESSKSAFVSGGKSSWNKAPQESEADKLAARWEFFKNQLGPYSEGVKSVAEICAMIEGLPESDKTVVRNTISSIYAFWVN
jgi:hypothetical protein